MAALSTKAMLIAGAGIALIGGAWAFAGGSSGGSGDGPNSGEIRDPIFGPNADEAAAAIKAEKERNAKIVEKALLALDFLDHDGPNKEQQVEGTIILAPKYARTYNRPFFDHINPRGGSSSSADLVAEESGTAVARPSNSDPNRPPRLLANENYEVIVDYATNKRFIIDHAREIIQEEPLVVTPGRPNTILADAQRKDPEAAKRLEKLFGQFSKARIDPKREFKLGSATGAGKTVTLNELPVTCSYYVYSMAGGKVGEVCYAITDSVEGLADVRDALMQYPLPGAGKNDTLSRMRQLAEIGGSDRFPVSFKTSYSGLDGDDYDTDLTGFGRKGPVPNADMFTPPSGYKWK